MATKRAETAPVREVDVLIGGAGFAGLSLAIALRQALGPSFSVTVADPALAAGKDERASAIAAAARRLFETIGVWGAAAGQSQPILDMVITDSRLGDAARPVFLTFDGEITPGEPFAHMIENRDLVTALVAKARDEGVGLRPTAIAACETLRAHAGARLADGASVAARLVVAADGARSRLRELDGIETFG